MEQQQQQQMTSTIQKEKRWFPLESNPEIMNKYIEKLGIKNTNEYAFHDVFGLDEDLLMMVPQPVLAVLLLYPLTKETEEANRKRDAEIEQKGQVLNDELYFLKQTIGNACGTIGIIHAIANNRDKLKIRDDNTCFLKEFFEKTENKSPAERAVLMEQDEKVEMAHEESANEGVKNDSAMETNLHFVCFVEHNGYLYELDGRRPYPINHGKSSADTLLFDAAKVIKQYMQSSPSDLINWNVVALAKAQPYE